MGTTTDSAKSNQPTGDQRVGFDASLWKTPEPSEWSCRLFGSAGAMNIVWTPEKGHEPNWFWRKMQFLCFGNRWEKKDQVTAQPSATDAPGGLNQ